MKTTFLFLFLVSVSFNVDSQSFDLVDRYIFDHTSKDPLELEFPVTDFFVADWNCGNLQDDQIVIESLETFEGYNVWQLENPELDGIDRVIMVELEWIGCCSYIESHYFLITDTCSFVKLDVIENESCDFPEDRWEYVFPSQELGLDDGISKVLTSFNIDGEVVESTMIEFKRWTDYNYDSSFVIEGVLMLNDYYGPPGWGEDLDGEIFQSWVLNINGPITVIESDPSESINFSVEGVEVVQLNKRHLNLKPYEGARVSLKGVFYSPHTGYHQELLLMDVEEIVMKE